MVENLSGIFAECYMISDLGALSGWNVGNVTGMNYAFETCISLSDVTGIAGWDTSKVESVSQMFSECEALTDASPLSGWDTGSVTDMFSAFGGMGITDASLYPSWYPDYKPALGGLSATGYSMQQGPGETPIATPGSATPNNAAPNNAAPNRATPNRATPSNATLNSVTPYYGTASPSDAEKEDGE